MTATTPEYHLYPYRLWRHNGQPLARSVAAAIECYEAAFGVAPNLILAPTRDAARIQDVTALEVRPDAGCLAGHIMLRYVEREAAT